MNLGGLLSTGANLGGFLSTVVSGVLDWLLTCWTSSEESLWSPLTNTEREGTVDRLEDLSACSLYAIGEEEHARILVAMWKF